MFDKIIGWFWLQVDKYMYKKFEKIYEVPLFSHGWGKKEDYERIKKYMDEEVTEEPHKIELEWLKEEEKESENGYKIQVGKFLSPVHFILQKGQEYCHFVYMSPKKESKKLIVIPPAGSSWRIKMLGNDYVEKGCHVIIPITPHGKFRNADRNKSPKLEKTYYNVLEAIACHIAFVQEIRSIVAHFINELNFEKVVISGISWGAVLSTYVARWPIHNKENVEIHIVPFLANKDILSKTFCDNLKHKELKYKKCDYYNFKNEGDPVIEKVFELVNDIIKPDSFRLIKSKTSINKVTAIHATNDCLIDKDNQNETNKHLKQILTRNGKDIDKDFKSLYYLTSHFPSFTRKNILKSYMEEVLKCFE